MVRRAYLDRRRAGVRSRTRPPPGVLTMLCEEPESRFPDMAEVPMAGGAA